MLFLLMLFTVCVYVCGVSELRGLQGGPMLTCELCGKVDSAHIFKGSKRFCSMLCAKR